MSIPKGIMTDQMHNNIEMLSLSDNGEESQDSSSSQVQGTFCFGCGFYLDDFPSHIQDIRVCFDTFEQNISNYSPDLISKIYSNCGRTLRLRGGGKEIICQFCNIEIHQFGNHLRENMDCLKSYKHKYNIKKELQNKTYMKFAYLLENAHF